MAKSPRFSIVIPCYNESAVIGRALRSLARQDFAGAYEIIVVDNNSSDDTAAKARQLGARVIEEKRPGVCWARQTGTEVARGEIIVSTDADSHFEKHWLTHLDAAFSANPDVVAVAGPFHYAGGPKWSVYAKFIFNVVSLVYKLTGHVMYAPGANFAFKKSAWEGYNTLMTQYGDEVDLLRKLRRKGRVVFDNRMIVHTSPRRLQQGFFYNVVVSFFLYSFLEYHLNRLFRRRFFGQAPAFRDEPESEKAYG